MSQRRTSWVEIIAWLARRRQRVRVTGSSMSPTLVDGDHVLIRERRPSEPPPAVGSLVWLTHPQRPGLAMVKRISAVTAEGYLVVLGDNVQHSTDSRHFGPVELSQILGVITWRFPRS